MVLSELEINDAQPVLIEPIVGVRIDGLLESLERVVFLPRSHVGIAQAAIAFVRIGRQFQSTLQLDNGLVGLAGNPVDVAQRKVDFGNLIIERLRMLGGAERLLRPGGVLVQVDT